MNLIIIETPIGKYRVADNSRGRAEIILPHVADRDHPLWELTRAARCANDITPSDEVGLYWRDMGSAGFALSAAKRAAKRIGM